MPGERDFLREIAKQVTRDEEKLGQLRGEDLEERFKRLRRGEAPPVEPGPSYSFIEGMEARPKPEPSFTKLMRRDPLESPLWGTISRAMAKPGELLKNYFEKPFAAALLTRIYEPEKYEAIIGQKRQQFAGELGIDLAQRETQIEELAQKVYIDPDIMRMWSETPFGEMEATVPFYAAEELKPGGELMKLYEEGDYPKYVRGATELGVSLPFYLLAWQGFAATPAGAAVNSGLNKSFQWLFKYPIAKYVKWKTGFTPAEIKWHQEVFAAYEKGVEAGAWQGIFKTNTVRNEVMKNTAKMYETSPDAALAYFNAFAKTDPQFVAVLSNYMDRVSILKLPGAVEASAGIKIFQQNMGLTPAPVAGGLAGRLPALPITAEKWAIISMPDKVNLVKSLGLSGKIASKAWEALTGAERSILSGEIPAVPEVGMPEAPITPALLAEEEIVKQPFELTSAEFNSRYPKLKDLTVPQQHKLLDMVNETNREVVGEEGVISLATFKKDLGDFHWDLEAGEILPLEHKELILDAVKSGYEVPANVRAEYQTEIAEIETKRAKAQALREQRREVRAEKPITPEVTIPTPEIGMPEPGIQAGALGVPSEIVTPLGRGEITQIGMDDYAKLVKAQMKELGIPEAYQFNVAKIDQRLAEINKLLAVTGKLPAGKGTRAELSIEQATLETQRDIVGMIGEAGTNREGLLGFIDTAIGEVSNEIGLRKMPYHGGVSENLFPDKTVPQLDEMIGVYQNFRVALTRMERPLAPPPPPAKAPKTLTAQLKDLYSDISTEVKASQAAIRGMTGDEARMARISLAEMERSLKNINKVLTAFEKEPRLPDATKLKQLIHIWARHKGFTQAQLETIYKRVTGTPKIRAGRQVMVGKQKLTNMTTPELQKVLAEIRRARPTTIEGKRVITVGTENKITSLKEALISEKKLSEGAFDDIMKQLKITTPRYISQYRFITEGQGKELIGTMNEEAEVGYIEQMSHWQEGLDKNPNVVAVVEEYEKRIAKEGKVYFEGKPADVSMLKDMRFLTEDLQTKTGKPFYHTYFLMNRMHQANRMAFTRIKLNQVKSSPEFRKITQNEAALKRINDYIAAKNKWLDVKSPPDITTGEVKLANALEDELLALQPDYRFHRFLNFYKQYEGNIDRIAAEIPDAPREDLKIAVRIYESKGAGQLKAYLDTRTWGVIESGFEPRFVVNPRLAQRSLRTTFPTGRFKSRSGVEFLPADMNIVQRVDRYAQQMLSFNLRPYIRKMERVYQEALPQLKNPGKVRMALSMSASEMMGYRERGFMYNAIMKVASQAYATVFGTMPVLPFRNLFQNLAFHPDKECLVDPRNKALTQEDWGWYHTNITQMEAIPRDLMLAEGGGLPGLRRFNRFIYRLNIYGASDSKVNRVWCYWGSLNKAKRALAGYEKDGDIGKFISNSGLADLTLQQMVDVLKILTVDKTRAIREIATEITNNVHFLYDRAQRTPWEMGGMGQIFGSLVIFPRSVLQRIFLQFKVLDSKSWAPANKKARAMKILLSMVLGSIAANYLFGKATGRKGAPYNPLNILNWSPGGLAIGSVTTLTDVAGSLFRGFNSEYARQELAGNIERAGDTLVPYYKLIISTLESALNMKYIDRLAVREIRSILEKKFQEMGFLDKAYEPNREFYEAERNWIWRIKHAIFGTEPPEVEPIKKATTDLADLEKQLGKFVMAEDSDDGYIYEMTDYASDLRRLTADMDLADITTEKGFSPLAVMYKQAEWYWDNYYYNLPASDRAAFRENPHDICAWTEAYLFIWGKLTVLRNPRSQGAVQQLMSQYNIPGKAVPALETQRGKGLPTAPSDLEERFKRLRGGGQGQPTAPVEESLEERFARLRRGE